ncbi:MAG: hypothetical protein KKB88_00535, partial [Nanoarchaeota archaeon]|nr:hypothetical protein [Nanoarchaeota archaeon]
NNNLLKKLFASALIFISGAFIFSLSNGFTGFVVSNSGSSSTISIVLIIVSLITGFWLLFEK